MVYGFGPRLHGTRIKVTERATTKLLLLTIKLNIVKSLSWRLIVPEPIMLIVDRYQSN